MAGEGNRKYRNMAWRGKKKSGEGEAISAENGWLWRRESEADQA